jgi:hypothetical protein
MLDRSIVVVSGLPRSGTSLMMQMLDAGGLPLLTDGLRAADADNPRGYFEYEPVKATERDASWLVIAQGKAVKVVSALLAHLPRGFEYRIVFMRRPIAAILASQREMLVRRGHPAPDATTDTRLAELFARHTADAAAAIERATGMRALYVDYPAVIEEPEAAAKNVSAFLGGGLDTARMAAVVDPALRRQR